MMEETATVTLTAEEIRSIVEQGPALTSAIDKLARELAWIEDDRALAATEDGEA